MRPLLDRLSRLSELGFLLFLGFSVLWKGGKSLEATWLLAGFAVLLTFLRWSGRTRDRTRMPIRPEFWAALMLFLVWSVISFLFSTTQNYGFDELLRDASVLLLFLWVVDRVRGPEGSLLLQRIFIILSVATIVACVIGIAVYALQPVNRFVGTFFDWRFTTDYWPNAWAQFLLLAWPVVFLLSSRFPLALRSVLVGVIVGSLFLSYSRGGILVFAVQAVLLLFLSLLQLRTSESLLRAVRSHGVQWCLFVTVTALVALAVFGGANVLRSQTHEVESVVKKATFTASEGSSSVSERRDFWEQSFALSLERPFVGWGPYSFRFIQPRLQTEIYATSDHPHNVFLKLAMERGWPALLFFIAILAFIFVPPFLTTFLGRSDAFMQARIALLTAGIGVFAHNLIDYNLQFVGIALPLWLMLGILVSFSERTFPVYTAVLRSCELLLAILLGCVAVFEGRTLVLSSLGRHAADSVEALHWYDQASGEIFSRDMHLSRAAIFIADGELESASAALDDYARVNAEDARLWIMRGNVSAAAGLPGDALAHYDKALELGKENYLAPLLGVLTLLSENPRAHELVARKELFLETFRQFGEAILINKHFIALSQNVETFHTVGLLLQRFYPSDKASIAEFSHRVTEHAGEERLKAQARTPGYLW